MGKPGNYSKEGSGITSRVTRIAELLVTSSRKWDPKQNDPGASVSRAQETSSGSVVFVNRSTGAGIASLLIFLVIGIAYVGTTFLTREHQIDRFREEQKQMQGELEKLKRKNRYFERRMVELSTQVENIEGNSE